MDLFNFDKEEKQDDYYSTRSHQDVYFIDATDRKNNLQYCRFCDCHRVFMFDRCTTCNNN